jgi:hypothetical protein
MAGLDPRIHQSSREAFLEGWMAGSSPAMTGLWFVPMDLYSITACSAPAACLRKLALVEPIMIANGMVQRMKIITI